MGLTYSSPERESCIYTPEFIENLPDMQGKVVVITGTSKGSLGFIIAQCMLDQNARVICINRDVSKSSELKGNVLHVSADLMDMDSIRQACATIKQSTHKVDILCNNAGVMMLPDTKNKDGYEVQMTTNHLSHFLITKQLFPILSDDARIINHTSYCRNVPVQDLMAKSFMNNLQPGELGNNIMQGRTSRYQQSKLANCVFTYALKEKLAIVKPNIKSLLVHPGISSTTLQVTSAASASPLFNLVTQVIMTQSQSAEDGAVPMIKAIVDPHPPTFMGPCEGIALLGMNYMRGYPKEITPEPYCCSRTNIDLLWEKSCAAIGEAWPL